MGSLHTLTIKSALNKLAKKEVSVVEIAKDVTEAINAKNDELNIYLTRSTSLENDAEKRASIEPLRGLPIAIKDNFLTKGMRTTAAAKVLDTYIPQYESTVTDRLQNAGASIAGKTNMDAWAHGSSTETSDYGATKNPRNPAKLPGGSSGGSAAAVAADMCLGAIGSETAGSIRLPAAWCGVVGFKPTYGRASRYGVVAMGSSLDSPGPMTKTVYDSAVLFETFAGKDPHDATTSPEPVPQLTKTYANGVKGFRVGITYIDHKALQGTPVAQSIEDAAKVFERLGATIEYVPLSQQLEKDHILTPDHAIGVYTVVQRAEVASNLSRYDGIRYGNDRSFFGSEAKRRMMLGTFVTSKAGSDSYFMAQRVRSLFIQNYNQLFEKFDILISPVSADFAPPLGATKDNPMFGELEDMLLEASSVSGSTGISVPCYHDPSSNLYYGLNIIANHWQEEKVIRAAYAFEQATNWNPWVAAERKELL